MDLKEKVGPLPAWAWGLILGSVMVAFIFLRRTPAEDSGVKTVDGLNAWGGSIQTVGAVTQPSEPVEVTNEQWLVQGVAYALTLGYSPLTAQRALSRYLSGEDLTAEEGKIVNDIISRFGIAPQGTAGIGNIITPQDPAPAPAPEPQSEQTAAWEVEHAAVLARERQIVVDKERAAAWEAEAAQQQRSTLAGNALRAVQSLESDYARLSAEITRAATAVERVKAEVLALRKRGANPRSQEAELADARKRVAWFKAERATVQARLAAARAAYAAVK